jgi:hypothetical protein
MRDFEEILIRYALHCLNITCNFTLLKRIAYETNTFSTEFIPS